jgi:LDH2 family malate/lactate/ureidoglycolate dehydrogenase
MPGISPASPPKRLITADALTARIAALFRAVGVPEAAARDVAGILVDADLRGVHSHGCRLAPSYLEDLRRGAATTQPNIRIVQDDGNTFIVDGDAGLGHLVAKQAMQWCIERTRAHGLVAVAVRNSRHCGAMAYYTAMAAAAGCVGFATTNAGVIMAPHGGQERQLGVDPMSWAFPTGRGWPVDLDMAPSVVAGGKLGVAIERGERIPLGWALDADGRPTDDPVAGQEGVLLPVGGAKGHGLAIVMNILDGVLTGGRFGAGLGSRHASDHFFMALAIERFMPLDQFTQRLDQLIDQLKASRLAEGSPGIFLPGEIEHTLKQERLRDGIPMDEAVMARLDAVAAELGVG